MLSATLSGRSLDRKSVRPWVESSQSTLVPVHFIFRGTFLSVSSSCAPMVSVEIGIVENAVK